MTCSNKYFACTPMALFGFCLMASTGVYADGVGIDKIYYPLVQPLEREVEFRALLLEDKSPALDNRQRYKLGYGQSLSEFWFVELYVIGADGPGTGPDTDAVELELKWQLTEQGEFENDWGMLFELERETEGNSWELSNTLIVQHEWPEWIGTINASLIYEWGTGVDNEFETSLSAQLKYRYKAELEPGVELHMSEDTRAIGPALLGTQRLAGRKKLLWSAAVLAGANSQTPDVSVNISLEFEF